MKRRILSAALAALALMGCKKTVAEFNEASEGEVMLDIMVPVVQTRFGEISDGNAVRDVQAFIFDEAGVLESYGYVTESNTCTVRCKKGTKEIVTLVNASSLSHVGTLDELMEARSDLLADNSKSYCVMEGRVTFDILESQSVTIPVTRHAAKITLEQVEVDFAAEHFDEETFEILAVYLVNVAGDRKFFSSDESTIWYNKTTAEEDSYDIIYDACADAVLSPSSVYEKKHQFYCYQNLSVSSASGLPWSPRPTRLVVEAKLGTDIFYYPVTVPGVRQNTAYNVRLRITRPGSSSPDIPVEVYEAESVIDIVDWVTGDTIVENI